jgi:DNA-binding transcriptional ArsR family regulator
MNKSQDSDSNGDQTGSDSSATTEGQLPEWIVECLSRLFSSIADPTRIRIVHALTDNDRLSVTELANHTGLSISAISHQLRLLRDRSLLHASREGRSVFYSLADDHLRALFRTGVQHAYEDCTNNLRRQAERNG